MPAGMTYNMNSTEPMRELCRFETAYRYSGGFNIEDENIPDGANIPVLAPIHIDFKARKASVVKNVKVVEAVKATDTTIKIAKGSLAYVNMFIGNGANGAKVTAINKTNAAYSVLTIAAAGIIAAAGDVLFEAAAVSGADPLKTANALNYADTKKEAGATLTALGQVYEIRESKLYAPISDKDKETLTSRFMFTY